MQPTNIHINLSKLRENYSNIIKHPGAEPGLLEGIFSELLQKPALREDEKSLVNHLCEDIGKLPFYNHQNLALAALTYKDQALKTHLHTAPFLTTLSIKDSNTAPNFALMTNDAILKHFHLDTSIKSKSAREELCSYIKNLQSTNLLSTLRFSDLEVPMLPRCFLTDPFFADMQINIVKKPSLPSNIKISEIQNLNVYKQVTRNAKTTLEEAFQTKDLTEQVFEYLNLQDLGHTQPVSKSMNMDSDYKYFRESAVILEKEQEERFLPEDLKIFNLSKNECNLFADKIDQKNLSLLTNLQKAGHIERKLDINALSRLGKRLINPSFSV